MQSEKSYGFPLAGTNVNILCIGLRFFRRKGIRKLEIRIFFTFCQYDKAMIYCYLYFTFLFIKLIFFHIFMPPKKSPAAVVNYEGTQNVNN